ncbi:alpha/beta hydrolase [Nocardioides sp.]|uniref:alpha/beta hydrolase n=1 Tax=Nocardioides sp. TaxID=35761 RepID=UPI0026354FD3|nr:alpha/beta hydrolase [Nocardioides sp.]
MSIFAKAAGRAGAAAGAAATKVTGNAEKVAFSATMALPDAALRRIAGPPVVLDGQTLAVDTQAMLKLAGVSGPAVETLPIMQGRKGLLRQSTLAGGRQQVGSSRDLQVAGMGARLYRPSVPADPGAAGPLLVFYHGGGFIYGDLDSHDAPARFLCEQSGIPVLSIDYRLAPEASFPAAYDDALAAFAWARENAATLGVDPARIGVGGDSAGGNLAAGVALAVGGQCAFQLLIYPVTETDENPTASRSMFGEGFFLTTRFIDLAVATYVPAGIDPRDPRLAPLYAEVPADIAPAFVATAGFDPLRDEGEAYATKLEKAGGRVVQRRYPDQIHGFLNVLLARSSRAATADMAAELRRGLA